MGKRKKEGERRRGEGKREGERAGGRGRGEGEERREGKEGGEGGRFWCCLSFLPLTTSKGYSIMPHPRSAFFFSLFEFNFIYILTEVSLPFSPPSLSLPIPIHSSISPQERASLSECQPAVAYQVTMRVGTSSVKAGQDNPAGGKGPEGRQ